ncbi:retrovirus-related Pol polyprotein from transposon TNT 1-94 [Trichonephila clavipes]|nr:retrovirus-related Pol polyprotein from transposon TNT 1-94 [Trichonephila clavipes]
MKQDLEKAENAYLSSFTSKKSKTLPPGAIGLQPHGDPNGKNDYQKRSVMPTAKTKRIKEIWHQQRFVSLITITWVKTSKNDSVKGLPRLTDNGRKPSVLHLKPFGCLAYAGVLKNKLGKIRYACENRNYDGYAQRTKGYRIWLIDENKLVETINVLAASIARFIQLQRHAATLCQFLIFRVFKSFSTSSIHLVGGLHLDRDPIGFLNVHGQVSHSTTDTDRRRTVRSVQTHPYATEGSSWDPPRTVGSLVVIASDSRPNGLGSMPDDTKYPPSTHGVRASSISGPERLVG